MKYEKIQIELLKARASGKFDRNCRYIKTEDYIVVTNTLTLIFIPKLFWYLDCDKVFDAPSLIFDVNKILDSLEEDIEDTETEISYDNGKLHIFKNQAGENIYIDVKLLDKFKNDKYDEFTFMGKGKKDPIAIYNQNGIVGVVLPVVKN